MCIDFTSTKPNCFSRFARSGSLSLTWRTEHGFPPGSALILKTFFLCSNLSRVFGYVRGLV